VKVAIVGAGAIGGYVGGLLSAAGEDVTFIARGANLDAIRRRGMQVVLEDGTNVSASNATACERPSEAGPQDVVYLTVKAHQVTPIAPELHHLCHETTSIVTMQNGIPWWYFQRLGGPYDGRPGEGRRSRWLDRATDRPGAHRRVGRLSRGEPGDAGRRACGGRESGSR
jgi:2-dehydropantoate 2-reductase